jgi:formylglycine-generating enzyme required for sulfatase activity
MPLDHINWRAQTAQLVAALQRWLTPRPGAAETPGHEPAAVLRDTDEGSGTMVAPASVRPQPGEIFRDAPDAPEMVVIPAGEFMMGSPAGEKGRSDDEGPQQRVTIAQPFAVGRFTVTFDEWDACVAAGGCAHKPGDSGWGRGRRPVINVSWHDAQEYVRWLSKRTGAEYRLLSEAEWEYAARAGSTTAYPWGDGVGSNHGNFQGSGSKWSGRQTAPVGSFEPNAFGLYDLIGNVWEWTQDCWNGSYEGAPADARPRENGDCGRRVVRGGAWINLREVARSAFRNWFELGFRNNGVLGFRLARTL